jgi:sensor histidine kinase YesM
MKCIDPIMNHKSDWEHNERLVEARSRIVEVPYEKVVATAYTLLEISNYIVEREYINIVKKTLDKNHMKLLEEEKIRTELEKSLKEAELKALYYQINPHFLFNALNTICRLAYIEKAKQTEELGYAFSDMMRYVLKKNSSEHVTIKDEINHSKNYLKIQKIRLGERLNYTIDVPEEHEDVECPFMVLQPLIENSVKYVAEAKEEGGIVGIRSYKKENDIIVEIEDDGDGISKEKISDLLSDENEVDIKDESIGIRNVNKRLIYSFGKEYGLEIVSGNNSHKGTIVKVKIKLDNKDNS